MKDTITITITMKRVKQLAPLHERRFTAEGAGLKIHYATSIPAGVPLISVKTDDSYTVYLADAQELIKEIFKAVKEPTPQP
ncbi:MAG: hypothetical protein D6765_17595 [Bacteroidetes bacterium]|nr:MAG: hypothetical protein D6765_17595 [Bacteroidota bacterium]